MGPLENERVALCIEQLLESELQILDLPVLGEASQPELREEGLSSKLAPGPEAEAMSCEGCGGTVAPSEAETRRGIAECSHCGGLTLLYDIDARMSALGTSTPDRCYDIDEDVDGLSIVPRDTNPSGGSIELTGDRIVLRRPGSAPTTLAVSSLEQVVVKEARSEEEFDLEQGLASLREATSLSGTIDLRSLSLGGTGAVWFQVTAQHLNHGEIEIAGGLQDPREAFLIARTLSRVLAKSA